jgi:hypothetical protein
MRQAPTVDDVCDVECLICPGLVTRAALEHAREIAHAHLEDFHPLAVAALRAGRSGVDRPDHGIDDLWRAHAAREVCETCYGILELPYWLHRSDPPTHVAGYQDSDAEWLLCDQCHELRITGRPGAWTRYVWTTVSTRYPWMHHLTPDGQLGKRAEIASTIRLLLERLDQGERLTL